MQLISLNGILVSLFLLVIFGVLLLIGEILRRQGALKGEWARKFVHATTGTWAALWPVFLDLRSIAFITTILTLAAIIVRVLKPMHTVYSIKRLSIGEIVIGFGLVLTALLAKNGAVFACSVLIIAWSDSLAALAGIKFGKRNSYKIFNAKKSIAGSMAFFISTFVIMMAFLYYQNGMDLLLNPSVLYWSLCFSALSSIFLTVVEAVSDYGIDNLTAPILAVIILNSIS